MSYLGCVTSSRTHGRSGELQSEFAQAGRSCAGLCEWTPLASALRPWSCWRTPISCSRPWLSTVTPLTLLIYRSGPPTVSFSRRSPSTASSCRGRPARCGRTRQSSCEPRGRAALWCSNTPRRSCGPTLALSRRPWASPARRSGSPPASCRPTPTSRSGPVARTWLRWSTPPPNCGPTATSLDAPCGSHPACSLGFLKSFGPTTTSWPRCPS
mmetsp:Transcript_50258/g.144859  ORF Transcript_50258/g.144859 Transcript_50258/m.144859 type:complete len:212 (+) Transcript_50258:274-909(+)